MLEKLQIKGQVKQNELQRNGVNSGERSEECAKMNLCVSSE